MVSLRLCQCGVPAVTGGWCWACAHEHTHPALDTIPWDDDWDDEEDQADAIHP